MSLARLRRRCRAALPTLAVCAAAFPLQAQSPPAASPAASANAPQGQTARRIATVEGITEYVLPNGLKVLLFPDQSKASITVTSVYFVGARDDAYGETGMAHLVEHLLFRSTKNHPDVPAEYTARSARRNGGTTQEVTYYYEHTPASDANLEWGIDLHADRMVNGTLDETQLASEYTVVRNEMEWNETDPTTIGRNRVLSTIFDVHAYGRRIVGAKSDIENYNPDRMRAFYRRYYQPDNAQVMVAGRFDPAKALALIERKFGVIPRPTRSFAQGNMLWRAPTAQPVQDGERYTEVRRVGDMQMILVGFQSAPIAHPDAAALDVLADVLGSNPSGRLYKALVDTREAAVVDGDLLAGDQPQALIFRTQLRMDQNADSVRARMVRLIDSARTGTFTEAEVARARNSLLRNIDLQIANIEVLSVYLAQWSGAGDWRLYFLMRDRIAKVTPEDIRRVAANYLKPTNRTVVALLPTATPDRAAIPARPNIAAQLAGYTGGAVAEAGEVFNPSTDSVNARVIRSTLPSGMRLSLLPKRSRNGAVTAQVVLRFGTEAALTGKGQIAALTATMLMRGTTSLTRQQLIDSLSKMKAAVTTSGGAGSVTVSIQTNRDNLMPVLDLVGQLLRTPRLDSADLDGLKKERLVALDNSKTQPIDQAQNAMYRRIAPAPEGSPLALATTLEAISGIGAVTIGDVRAFHRTFYGVADADMAVVGDFEAPAVAAAAARLFGDWKSPHPFVRLTRAYKSTDSTLVSIETPDKTNAAIFAGQAFPLRDDDPDFPAVLLAHQILGGAPSARMTTRIRERDGLSYGISSFFIPHSFDRFTTWQFFAMVAPQNAERAELAFHQELARALKEGFTAEELERTRDGLLKLREQSRTSDTELVVQLVGRAAAGRTFAWDKALEAKIAALTLAEVNAALRKYFIPSDVVMSRAGDFVKNPPLKPTP